MILLINVLFREGRETSVFLAGVGRFRRRDRRILHQRRGGMKEQFLRRVSRYLFGGSVLPDAKEHAGIPVAFLRPIQFLIGQQRDRCTPSA
jgi:hypothetical protein